MSCSTALHNKQKLKVNIQCDQRKDKMLSVICKTNNFCCPLAQTIEEKSNKIKSINTYYHCLSLAWLPRILKDNNIV